MRFAATILAPYVPRPERTDGGCPEPTRGDRRGGRGGLTTTGNIPHSGSRRGTVTQNRESLEGLSLRQAGSAGPARSGLRGVSRLVCSGNGAVGLWQIHTALRDRKSTCL